MDDVVRFEKITKHYNNYKAVDCLDLVIEAGKFFTLLGPSGCGKSTTLRMLGGFETPDSGRVMLDGKDVTHLPPNRRDVNIVFQDYALFPHMSVGRNIAFGMEMQGRSTMSIQQRVSELLDLVQLRGHADRQPWELSGGQRQRVALIRALAPSPKVLLLDEPLSALDAKLRQQMQIELKSIQKKTGKTFLFVTHDQEEAVTMSDQIVVMNEGRIEQIGAPQKIYSRPRNRFVANFIGETNRFDGCTVLGRGTGVLHLDWNGNEVQADDNGTDFTSGDQVNVVVRPESIRCTSTKATGANTLSGRIVQRVFKGNHTLLSVEIPSGRTLNVVAEASTVCGLAEDAVYLSWSADTAVVLHD